jgi:hypothetical protein
MRGRRGQRGAGSCTLLSYQKAPEAWIGAALPWLHNVSAQSAEPGKKNVVFGPDAAHLARFKADAISRGQPLFGIECLTPARLRTLLRGSGAPEVALQEDLHLACSLAAARLPDNPVAQAAVKDPLAVARAIDAWLLSGHPLDRIADRYLRELAREVNTLLLTLAMPLAAQADRQLSLRGEGMIENLLIYGFQAEHWANLSLVTAAVDAASSSVICVCEGFETDLEMVTFQTLEERYGPAISLAGQGAPEASSATVFAAEALERAFEATVPLQPEDAARVEAILATDIWEAATLAVDHCLRYASTPLEAPVALVVANPSGAQGRAIAAELSRRNLPHCDVTGGYAPGSASQQQLQLWVQLQQERTLDSFVQWLHGLDRLHCVKGLPEALKQLDSVFVQTLSDALPVASAYAQEAFADSALVDLLNQWPLLPEVTTLEAFQQEVLTVCKHLQWPPSRLKLEVRLRQLSEGLGTSELPLWPLMQWLSDICRVPGRTRHELGRQPFGCIYLLSLNQAAGLNWGGVVIAGMGAHEWPPVPLPMPFLSDLDCEHTNRKALSTGRFSDAVLKAGFSLLPTVSQQRARCQSLFQQLLRHSSGRLTAICALTNPADDGAINSPAQDWHRCERLMPAKAATPSPRSPAPTQNKARKPLSEPPSAACASFLKIWRARRDPQLPYGPEGFGLKAVTGGGLKLPARGWESAVTKPAQAWFEHILSVRKKKPYSEVQPRSLAIGLWLHDWLALEPEAEPSVFPSQSMPDKASHQAAIEKHAHQLRKRVEAAYSLSARTLPDWWQDAWALTKNLTHRFAAALPQNEHWPYALSEFQIPQPSGIHWAGASLNLSGIIDWVCLKEAKPSGTSQALLIDFKSGSDQPLSPRKLEKGTGLQLLLYAHALVALGVPSSHIQLALLGRKSPVIKPLGLTELDELPQLQQRLQQLCSHGVFGLSPAETGEFSTLELPLATLLAELPVLQKKWELTVNGGKA